MKSATPKTYLINPPPLLNLYRQNQAQVSRGRGGDNLLKIPFVEWCKSLQIKTEKGLKPFELFEWQADFSEALLSTPRTPFTLLSSRQTGKTAMVLALLVWLSLSRYQFTAVVTHRKGDDVRQLARRCKKFIPSDTRLESDSLSLISFEETQSELHFRSCNPRNEDGAEAVGRGLASVDLVVIEEASHTTNVAEIMTVLGPTLTHSAMATVLQIGTAGRKETAYYSGLVDAFGGAQQLEAKLQNIRQGIEKPFHIEVGKNRIAVITNWRAIPKFAAEPDYIKRIQREQDLADSQIESEHELIFDSDKTTSVFDFKLVKQAQAGTWERPETGAIYYAGVDGSGRPRTGRKGDYTVCIVIEKTPDEKFKVIQLYRKRGITFERRYAEISEILNDYSPIKTLIEANDGLGQTYHENISNGCLGLNVKRFNNNNGRKAAIVNKIQLALEKETLIIPKSAIIDELLSFQQLENGELTAVGKNAHDDTVMALGMALQAAS